MNKTVFSDKDEALSTSDKEFTVSKSNTDSTNVPAEHSEEQITRNQREENASSVSSSVDNTSTKPLIHLTNKIMTANLEAKTVPNKSTPIILKITPELKEKLKLPEGTKYISVSNVPKRQITPTESVNAETTVKSLQPPKRIKIVHVPNPGTLTSNSKTLSFVLDNNSVGDSVKKTIFLQQGSTILSGLGSSVINNKIIIRKGEEAIKNIIIDKSIQKEGKGLSADSGLLNDVKQKNSNGLVSEDSSVSLNCVPNVSVTDQNAEVTVVDMSTQTDVRFSISLNKLVDTSCISGSNILNVIKLICVKNTKDHVNDGSNHKPFQTIETESCTLQCNKPTSNTEESPCASKLEKNHISSVDQSSTGSSRETEGQLDIVDANAVNLHNCNITVSPSGTHEISTATESLFGDNFDVDISNMTESCKSFNKSCVLDIFKNWRYLTVRDHVENTLLHRTVLAGNVSRVKRLCIIHKCLNITLDLKNKEKQTALHLAARKGNHKMMSILLEYGASQLERDGFGNMPLHLAVINGHTLCVQKLTASSQVSVPVNEFNDEGFSPLHLAAINGNLEIFEALMTRDPIIDLKDLRSGRTALFHAIENKNQLIVIRLVKLGAGATVQNFCGHTPIFAANELGSSDKRVISELITTEGLKKAKSKQLLTTLKNGISKIGNSENDSDNQENVPNRMSHNVTYLKRNVNKGMEIIGLDADLNSDETNDTVNSGENEVEDGSEGKPGNGDSDYGVVAEMILKRYF